MYSKLSSDHRELVAQGKISEGMPMDAVFLAWGPPARTYQSSSRNKQRERWDYYSSRAVQTDYGYGYGYLRHHHYDGGCAPYYVAPEVTFVPYRSATVWFENGVVDSWEHEK